jgi:hypothetical protein
VRLAGPPMVIDQYLPRYDFGESHSLDVAASADTVYAAIRRVTAGEIRFFRLLTWLRAPRFGSGHRESVLNAPADKPVLETALGSGFFVVHDAPGRELVVGTLVVGTPRPRDAVEFLAQDSGDLAKAMMNFHIEERGAGRTRLWTQTRIGATTRAARRRFALYWFLIHPGSAFIRLMWLRAIRARATRLYSDPSGE